MAISSSLARGLAKRNMREASMELQTKLNNLTVPAYRRRGKIYGAYLRTIQKAFDGYILWEFKLNDKKRSGCFWLVWWPTIIDGRPQPGIALVNIEMGEEPIAVRAPLALTWHILHRIYQRVGSEDPLSAMAELKPAMFHLMTIACSDEIDLPISSFEWPTDHGIIIVEPDKETLILKTFVDIEKLGKGQRIRREAVFEVIAELDKNNPHIPDQSLNILLRFLEVRV